VRVVTGTPSRRPTVQDVAREAGVSPSTVSRALNGSGYVAAEVRDRVLAAAAAIGYVPDVNAQNLRNRTTRTIGVLISDLRNPFYANLAAGIEHGLRQAGWHMMLVNDDGDPAEELEAVRTLLAMRVSGVILTPVSVRAVSLLRDQGVRVVQADRRMGRGGDAVMSANESGAEALTRHLLELGHRRIGLLIDETQWSTGAGRLAGYRAAHAAAGVPVDDTLVAYTSFDAAAAGERTDRLLTERPDLTAVFAANNVLAQGAFDRLRSRGLRIPRDVSLVAYDDVPWMSMVSPAVTTVSQHTFEMGQRCAALLLERMADGGRARTVRVEATLLERESAGPAPGA
jgi:LacI family transcriptional regulator